MAKIKDSKSLSPEGVAALSGKEVSEQKPSEELVEVEPLKIQVNTSVYGHLYKGKTYKIGKALAKELEALGEVNII